MSPVPYVADFAAPKPSLRHGDDVAPVRERRGTTPLAHTRVRRSTVGDDGPTRSVLLGRISCSSEGSPVMAGSVPLKPILVTGANQNGGGSSSSPLGGAFPAPIVGESAGRAAISAVGRHRLGNNKSTTRGSFSAREEFAQTYRLGRRPSGGQLETPSSNGTSRLCRIEAIICHAPIAVTNSINTAGSAPNSRSHAAHVGVPTAPSCTTSSVAVSTARGTVRHCWPVPHREQVVGRHAKPAGDPPVLRPFVVARGQPADPHDHQLAQPPVQLPVPQHRREQVVERTRQRRMIQKHLEDRTVRPCSQAHRPGRRRPWPPSAATVEHARLRSPA